MVPLRPNIGAEQGPCSVNALNTAGIRTRADGPWHSSAIQPILKNPVYTGTLTYGDIAVGRAFPAVISEDRWKGAGHTPEEGSLTSTAYGR